MDSVIYNFQEIDLVIVNFYPFEKVLRKTNNQKKIIENIDIGGPALARAAAKNYEDVAVLTNISQYEDFIIHLKKHKGSTSIEFRKILSFGRIKSSMSADKTLEKTKNAEYDDDTVVKKDEEPMIDCDNPRLKEAIKMIIYLSETYPKKHKNKFKSIL